MILSDENRFFHENVGISAWGLAVHQYSRLIAVGTNNSNVHVFQPALAVCYDAETGGRYYQEGTSSNCPDRCFTAATSPFTLVSTLDFGSAALGDFGKCCFGNVDHKSSGFLRNRLKCLLADCHSRA